MNEKLAKTIKKTVLKNKHIKDRDVLIAKGITISVQEIDVQDLERKLRRRRNESK